MTQKGAFNADEWTTLVNAPAFVALLVIAADRGGSVRESLAAQRTYAETAAGEPGELLREIISTPAAVAPGQRPEGPDELRQVALDMLPRAVGILERAATDDEVVEYKRFVYRLAETVARAHKEGGFLGIGGKEISEPEQAVLDEIAGIFDRLQS